MIMLEPVDYIKIDTLKFKLDSAWLNNKEDIHISTQEFNTMLIYFSGYFSPETNYQGLAAGHFGTYKEGLHLWLKKGE